MRDIMMMATTQTFKTTHQFKTPDIFIRNVVRFTDMHADAHVNFDSLACTQSAG